MKVGDEVRWVGPSELSYGPKDAPTHTLPVNRSTGRIDFMYVDGGVDVRMARDGMDQACHETAESFAAHWSVA